jgi:hypothetical protein
MLGWFHASEQSTRRKTESFSALTPAALVFPKLTDDILRAVIAVCIALLSVLIIDQWLMGGSITDRLF